MPQLRSGVKGALDGRAAGPYVVFMGPNTCDHGVSLESFCMQCCREGEGKPAAREEPRSWCHVCNEPYGIEHTECGERDPQDC